MMTRKSIALYVGAVALLAAGCSSASVAATVDDSEIEESAVLALSDNADDQVSTSGDRFRDDLTRLIFTEATVSAAEDDFGFDDLDSDETRDAYVGEAGPEEQQYLSAIAADPNLTDAAYDLAVTQLMLQSELIAAVGTNDAILGDIWQEYSDTFVEVCASHILVATEEEAVVVVDRLEAGEAFAVVADDVSLDSASPGGALPCPISPSVFVEPFASTIATAHTGEITGPVLTEFGWHVIVVDSREAPQSVEELADDPARWIPQELAELYMTEWIRGVVEDLTVVVRSDIGTWVPSAFGILPPPQSP